jgi:hypothetical protein
MNQRGERKAVSGRRFKFASAIFAALGLLLFVYFVKRAGIAEVIEGTRRVGAGFLVILALSGIRFVVRTLAWMKCVEAPYALRFRDAFRAYLAGDAMGNLVPLGIMVSEPAKAALVRDRLPLVAGLSGVAVENILYTLSVALFIFSGAVALLFNFQLPEWLRLFCLGALAVIIIFVLAALFMLRRQWRFLSGAIEWIYARGLGRRALETRRGRVQVFEDRVYGFYGRNRARLLPVMLLEACFHAAGVAEVYLTLFLISGAAPPLLAAFVLESVNRVINVVFKFVPLKFGVDEAGTGSLAGVLSLATASGVTVAIVRKARVIFWIALGLAWLIRRGLSVRAVAAEAEAVMAAQTDAAPTVKL